MLVIAATTAILTIIGAFYFRTMRGKQVRTQLLFCLPFISTIMRDYSAARFFISLSLLTKGGVQLVPALHLIYTAEPYFLVRQMWQNVYNDVFEGIALSDALYADAKESCLPETISILKVGESSGRLSEMLEVVAHIHHNRVKQKLYAFITFLQPALLLILGLFIALLIFAIYMPIFNLSIGLS
jgi:type IV pilus assembly protein PilC